MRRLRLRRSWLAPGRALASPRAFARPKRGGRRRPAAAHAPGPERGLKRIIAIALVALAALPLVGDFTLGIARPMAAGDQSCGVVRVIDGDTVDIRCAARGVERARLTGFDTPELFSPACAAELSAAVAAKWHLRRLLWSADTVTIDLDGHDRYDRRLAEIRLDGERLAERMIADGHARAYDGGQRGGWCG